MTHVEVPLALRLRERLVAPFWRVYRGLETDFHQLHYLFWEATLRCNFACRHCGSDCRKDPQGPELSADEVLKVFRDVADAYNPAGIVIVATGGEPLMRPDLLKVLAQARRMGFPWGMVTNGWRVTPELASACKRAGMLSVVVSLDGLEAQHEWLRGRKGSHARALAALQAFKAAGIPTVEAITCVHNGNLGELEAVYQSVREAGATHWRVFNIFPMGRAAHDRSLLLSPEGLRTLTATLVALRKRGAREGLKVNFSDEGYFHPCLDVQLRDARFFCRAGINVAGLLADGSVAACPNLPRHLVQGTIKERSFPDIWEGEYGLFRNRSWMRTGPCIDCHAWRDCQGNALHGYDWETHQPSRCHLAETLPLLR